MIAPWTHERILIWGKTYPELSVRHTETVCTAGVREDGRPIRLYPVGFRYLEPAQQYGLYDVISVRVKRNLGDPRPESHKIDVQSLAIVGHLEPDSQHWAARREWIDRTAGYWHFNSVAPMLDRQRHGYHSIGLVRVGAVDRCYLAPRSAGDRARFEAKAAAHQAQSDLFARNARKLDFIPNEIRLVWRCAERCSQCAQSPHDMSVLDWGLIQLARREGWEMALDRLKRLADPASHDFKLFLGNFFTHQSTFGIIGLWYPKLSAQTFLL